MIEIITSDSLVLIYAILLALSLVFVVLNLIGADLGDAFDFDLDLDFDVDIEAEADPGFNFPSISPFAIAVFMASFGAFGIFTRLGMGMTQIGSIGVSMFVGLLFGAAAQALFVYVLSPTKSSHFSLADDAEGRRADVIVSIPANGKGTITFDNASGRLTLAAQSKSGQPINTGKSVIIEKIVGRVAHVYPIGEDALANLAE